MTRYKTATRAQNFSLDARKEMKCVRRTDSEMEQSGQQQEVFW